MKRGIRKILASLFFLVAGHELAFAQLTVDLSKSFVFAPLDAAETVNATHIKVPGIGAYDATFRFNPSTLGLDLVSATPSQTDEVTESLVGTYACGLYNDTQVIFTTTVRPAGRNLVFGGGLVYTFIGTSGSNNWKYTYSFPSGGKYLLSIVKESETRITALHGYLPAGETALNTTKSLLCEKKG